MARHGAESLWRHFRQGHRAGIRFIVMQLRGGLGETLMTAPDLFDTYIAIDPSLWWNDGALTKSMGEASLAFNGNRSPYIATSADGQGSVDGDDLRAKFSKFPGLSFHFQHWPGETHATIFHPAALTAFRSALKP